MVKHLLLAGSWRTSSDICASNKSEREEPSRDGEENSVPDLTVYEKISFGFLIRHMSIHCLYIVSDFFEHFKTLTCVFSTW